MVKVEVFISDSSAILDEVPFLSKTMVWIISIHSSVLRDYDHIITELRRPKSGAPYPYSKQKETHELIFS